MMNFGRNSLLSAPVAINGGTASGSISQLTVEPHPLCAVFIGELPAFTELAALSDTGAPASYRPVRHETAATAAFAASLSGAACAATLTRACADWIACC